MISSNKNLIKFLIFALLGGVLVFLVFKDQNLEEVYLQITHANFYWVVFAMLVGLISHWLRALRWNQLLETTVENPGIVNSFCAVMVGYLVNYAIPRAGEISRCAMLKKSNNIELDKSIGTVVIERVFDVVIMLILLLFALVFQSDQILKLYTDLNTKSNANNSFSTILIILFVLGVGSLITGFLFRKKLAGIKLFKKILTKISGFFEGIKSIIKIKNKPLFFLYTFLIWLCYLMMMYIAFQAVPSTESLTFDNAITVLVAGSLAMIVPTPGGIGAFHYFSASALMLFGVNQSNGYAWATIVHGAQMLMFVLIGSICYFWLVFQQKNEYNRSN